MKLYPITDPVRIAALEAQRAALVASAVAQGVCAHVGVVLSDCCLLAPHHLGLHQGRDFSWDDTGPAIGRPS